MSTMQVDILNPKAEKLLEDLADMNLISIQKTSGNSFLKAVYQLREKAKKNPLSLEDITIEVEKVRAKRYAKERK